MSKLFPQSQIYAFEPVPETYFTLCENIKLNECKNIISHNLGLGDSTTTKATMVVANNFSGGSSGVITFDPASQHQVEVGIIGLDRAMEMCKVDKVKLLKMDIEGMEYDVLYDSEFFNDKRVENFTGEIHLNQRLEFKCYRVQGLVTWIANRSRIIHIETCKMAE
jgi:FkbM family methyltransferase